MHAEQDMDLTAIFPGISEQQLQKLRQFSSLVKTWNRRMNLVSRSDGDRLWEHHLLPSIIPLNFIDIAVESWILDIGSGGGFPAIPLKTMRPDLQIVMVDSIRKKTLFLKQAIADLKLQNITVMKERVEILSQNPDFHKRFDVVTARAVDQIDILIKWGRPFLKDVGYFLLWKGESDISELEQSAALLNYRYTVHSVPEALQEYSRKFKELRWFRIDFTTDKT